MRGARLAGFEGRSQLRTWVFRVLVNVARRRGRTENRMNTELRGPDRRPRSVPRRRRSVPGPLARRRAPRLGPRTVLLAAEFREILETALAELPERQRAVVELRDVHGLPCEEVGQLLELSPANQRVLLHRGRAKLRGVLEGAIG